MKRILIFVTYLLFITCISAQEFISPSKNFFTSKTQVYFVGQYRKGGDGLYHYLEMKGREVSSTEYNKYTEGLEHFYCYDKNSNMFYFYTDNTIGYYNPTVSNNINFLKNYMKKADVKKVNEAEATILMENIIKGMNEKYDRMNDSIAEIKRIAREKFVKDSIETAQKKAKEQEEYRKNNDWHDLQLSTSHSLKCQFCDSYHSMDYMYIISLSADTVYYLHDDTDITLLGNKFKILHYSAMPSDLKNDIKFKKYVNIWRDSIANNNSFSNQDAAVFNLIQYNEFKDKIYSIAPNGFMQYWGWKLNSAQGIEPYFCFFNSSKKTIKYVDFYFSVFNAVGDKCYLKFERSYIGNVRGVGPVEPFDSGSWSWDMATHYTSGDASEMRIVKLVITYMNGTTKTIPNSAIIYDN